MRNDRSIAAMSHLRQIFGVATALLAWNGCVLAAPSADSTGSAAAPVAAPRADIENFFDGMFGFMLDQQSIAGAIVSVVENGEVVLTKGYGYSDVSQGIRADGTHTRFRIGSITKLFTYTAVMQQVEKGRLDLDADVNRYLDFQIPATYQQAITLRHLITHTAGFEDKMLGLAAPSEVASESRTLRDTMIDALPARVRPPGEQAAYSNYGAALAAYVVERVTGQSFDAYVQKHIFEPLGMQDTTYLQSRERDRPATLSRSYRYRDGGLAEYPVEHIYAYPAGAVSSTAHDMANFMLAHLQDGRLGSNLILEPRTAQQMRERLFANAPGIEGMAYGSYEVTIDGRRLLGHGGKVAGFTSLLLICPETGTGTFVALNTMGRTMAIEEPARAYMRRFHPTGQTRAVQLTVPEIDVHEYIGSFKPNIRNETGIEHAPAAFAAAEIRAGANGGLLLQLGPESIRWLPVERDIFVRAQDGELGNRLVFLRDANGAVSGFADGSRPYAAFNRMRWFETPGWLKTLLGVGCAGALLALILAIRRMRRRPESSTAVSRLHMVSAAAAAATILSAGFMLAGVARLATLPATTPAAIWAGRFLAGIGVALIVLTLTGAVRVAARNASARTSALAIAVCTAAIAPFYWALYLLRLVT